MNRFLFSKPIIEVRFINRLSCFAGQNGSDYPMQPYHFSDGSICFICLATALTKGELIINPCSRWGWMNATLSESKNSAAVIMF